MLCMANGYIMYYYRNLTRIKYVFDIKRHIIYDITMRTRITKDELFND